MSNLYANCKDDSLFVTKLGINIYEEKVITENDLLKPDRSAIDSMVFYAEENMIGPVADGIFYHWYKVISRDTLKKETPGLSDNHNVIIEYVQLTTLEDYEIDFEVDFPRAPSMSLRIENTSSMRGVKVQTYESVEEDPFYGVSKYKVPSAVSSVFNQELGREGFLKGKIGGFAYETNQDVVEISNDNSDSFFGKKFELKGNDNELITFGKVLLVNRTVYFITASSEMKRNSNDLIHFLESFRLK